MQFLRKIEEKWQRAWESERIFEADPDLNRKKFFITFPYPYINGPIHVGHAFTASRTDAYARFKRMQGCNVLFPWAWHWTGQPLIGASQRVASGDKEFIRILKEVDGVPDEELEKFVDPIYMATYYTNESRIAARRTGFSVDWRREFNTTMLTFQKFIQWQYEKLRAKGYVSRGTHPVVWCPQCRSPTGDHDRQVGEGVAPEEYTLIKFKLNTETSLPAATFRPETIYGATNIWIHPEASYVEAEVDNEKWMISEEAAGKLKEQVRTVKITRKLKGRELVGRTLRNPVGEEELPILPGWFVDPSHATGVVYSVPAHAPYDWLALKDLKEKPEILKEFGIKPKLVKSIKPKSIIQVEGFGDYPAAEIVEELKIEDQYDPKAEKATNVIYKKEFHNGVLKENCMEYAGRTVQEVKETLTDDFKRRGIADFMYDLPKSVVCRCLTTCIVKVLQDQWFLRYSDPKWKNRTRETLRRMNIYPETATLWFQAIIDWLKEWACARRTGLGTPLPWSTGWIVETLSDSTIYMAFYTINKHIRLNNVKAESLTDDVFNYIFFGEKDIGEVASQSGIARETLEEMRKEFLYWYPVNLRVSAKELVPNHLTFFIFHHVALFPPEHLPKAIGVNGMLMIEGKQMHKSKGNFVPVKNAINKYGADATRCGLILGAEGMDDPDWRTENIRDMSNKLESFYKFARDIIRNARTEKNDHLEKWLLSTLQHRLLNVTKNLDQMRTRTALEIALFEIWNDFRWYMNRKGGTNIRVPREFIKLWLKLLAPFAPHMCEELWSEMGEKRFISLAKWPELDRRLIDARAEEQEYLIKKAIEDTLQIMKATKIAPQRICYYTASRWRWSAYLEIVQKSGQGELKLKEIIKELAAKEELRGKLDEVAKFAATIIEEVNRISNERRERVLKIGELNEKRVLERAKQFLADRFKADIIVHREDEQERYDPDKRARRSIPYRPAIYIE